MSTLPAAFPLPIEPQLRGGPVLRWGILAPGFIAAKFAQALLRHTDQRIVAVASRSGERAARFAAEHAIQRHYDSYAALLADDAVAIVYIAAPHSEHAQLALLAIAAGKHVLVEKPLAATADEARQVRDAAAARGVFAMEAMHTRFHPRTTVLDQLLRDGVLGEPLLVTADLGLAFPVDHASRLYDPALAGGALLDLAVYSLWFAAFVLGQPTEATARGSLTETGVDAQSVVVLGNERAQQAVVTTNMRAFTPSQASVSGTRGRVLLDARHPLPGGFTLSSADNTEHIRFEDTSGITFQDGLCRQAVWAAQHISDGLVESPLHPLAMSIGVLETIDPVRAQLGVTAVHGASSASD